MVKLVVCSEPDLPSVNMRKCLVSKSEWNDLGSDGYADYSESGDIVLMSIPDLHIYADDLDIRAKSMGIEFDEVIFMSKHAAASGEPALTVHPIGNFHDNKFGGKEMMLVHSDPALMSDALRLISSYNRMPQFKVCYEVTHHGPWLDIPTFFIEIGSDGRNWGNMEAAEILADVIRESKHNDYMTAVGVGGGHYAPRFTEVALKYKVNFGHMIPNYQLEGRDDEDILRMVKDACGASSADTVYVHRKSMKGPVERHISELISSEGFEIVSSTDLEPLTGNR